MLRPQMAASHIDQLLVQREVELERTQRKKNSKLSAIHQLKKKRKL